MTTRDVSQPRIVTDDRAAELAESAERLVQESYKDTFPPENNAPDLPQLSEKVSNIRTLTTSGSLEAARQNGQALARTDYFSAISEADKIDKQWVFKQSDMVIGAQADNLLQYHRLTIDFQAAVQALPAPTRQRVNQLLAEAGTQYEKDFTHTWDKNPELEQKVLSALPPDLRSTFREITKLDRANINLQKGQQDAEALHQMPLATRVDAAAFLGQIGDVEGSRALMNEVLKLNPALKNSPVFGDLFLEPAKWGEADWFGLYEQFGIRPRGGDSGPIRIEKEA